MLCAADQPKVISDFDLPAKVFIPSVALGKIVGVLGNEARMVVRYLICSCGGMADALA